MAKLSKKRQAEIDAQQEAEMEAYERYYNKYNDLVFKATVISGGKGNTEFLVRCIDTDKLYWVYACNIKGAKTMYPETACVYLNEGDIVEVQLTVFTKQTFASVITQGRLDNERWNRLDHSKLAFKYNDDGSTTGII